MMTGHDQKKVTIIDACPGTGKTTYLAEMINRSNRDSRWLVITPYLNEVKRLVDICADRDFVEPDIDTKRDDDDNEIATTTIKPTKLQELKRLLAEGKNIVSTHALFIQMDKKCLELIEDAGYHLIIDEQIPVCANMNADTKTLEAMIRREILALSDVALKEGKNVVKLLPGPEKDLKEYDRYRRQAEADRLWLMHNNVVLWVLPIDLLSVFRSVTVATYMFMGSPMNAFFDMFDIEQEEYTLEIDPHTKRRTLVPYNIKTANAMILDAMNRIEVYEGPYNAVGEGRRTKLSKTSLGCSKALRNDLRKAIGNFFRHVCNGEPGSLNLWTCHKAFVDDLKGKGYIKQHVALNKKATNEYGDRKNIAYGLNLYMNGSEVTFFQYLSHDGEGIDQDAWSLSELVQFIWRSRIRYGQSIRVFLPSRRMRELFVSWMDKIKSTADITLSKAA